LFARERETVDVAYPGDVVGLVGHDEFRIGDTLAEDASVVFEEIPRFTPECFAYLHSTTTAQFKRFREGLEQLLQEGVVQAFFPLDSLSRVPLLGAVGPLQFEVVQFRLQSEYGAESRMEQGTWSVVRWVMGEAPDPVGLEGLLPTGARMARDAAGNLVILFTDPWACEFFSSRQPEYLLSAAPPKDQPTAA
ncbi:MAG: peptide chain release factor 3, partial [Verrucomicrobia bacterium]|nr:peptide chain release factor 3 [Verrucomicrobiota bacterium]